MSGWYARPVLFVSDIDRASAFYVERLGFTERWRFGDDGQTMVAQVDREGCELILSSQWPDKAGTSLMFISLDDGVIDSLRVGFEERGIGVKDGHWGYPLMIVADPDGNQLYFPYPQQAAAA